MVLQKSVYTILVKIKVKLDTIDHNAFLEQYPCCKFNKGFVMNKAINGAPRKPSIILETLCCSLSIHIAAGHKTPTSTRN